MTKKQISINENVSNTFKKLLALLCKCDEISIGQYQVISCVYLDFLKKSKIKEVKND